MLTIYRTTPNSVTWDVDGRAPRTSSAAYLASRKAYLVRTGGDELGRVNVAGHLLDESQIDTLLAAIKDHSRSSVVVGGVVYTGEEGVTA